MTDPPSNSRQPTKMLPLLMLASVSLLSVPDPVMAGEVLTPAQINLALEKPISATASCGSPRPDYYCSLGGADPYNPVMSHFLQGVMHPMGAQLRAAEHGSSLNVTGGMNCGWCDANDPTRAHPPSNMVDGSHDWWQSPPLSRGNHFDLVNITVDLQQEFEVAYVLIQMAQSPRPAVWALERSNDFGKTWHPWQYFAEMPTQCEQYFGPESLQPVLEDDSVTCSWGSEFTSSVPLHNGEIFVQLVQGRPGSHNFTHAKLLQEFVRATNVRLRLIRTNTLKGHYMDFSRNDPTVTRRYYYAIKEITMGGRCLCHGHAQTCKPLDPARPKILLCQCEHNTCGDQCDQCCPGFEQKPWQPARTGQEFQCEPCNCHGHSSTCYYDADVAEQQKSLDIHGNFEGGGVCTNCNDNTDGVNCEKCAFGFFRPEGRLANDSSPCEPCSCNPSMHTGDCRDGDAQCYCNERFVGPFGCQECAEGFYEHPECKACPCYVNGTDGRVCLPVAGFCPCLPNYAGSFCSDCAAGFHNLTAGCDPCDCSDDGAMHQNCSTADGQCACKSNFGGKRCDQCDVGYYDFPSCEYCDCDQAGTEDSVCNETTGECICKEGFSGDRCDVCSPQYYGYPDCKPCACDPVGTSGVLDCDLKTGECPCTANFTSRTCDLCAPGYFAYPSCEQCDCFGLGSSGITCNDVGQCYCKDDFQSLKCDQCKPERYNFPLCEECNCNPSGVASDFAGCDAAPEGELCVCKENVIGRICDQCKPTTWDLQRRHPGGCVDCACDARGTVSSLNVCSMDDGQCECRGSAAGRRCDRCKPGHFDLQAVHADGCKPCHCDAGGAIAGGLCDAKTGACRCVPRVAGAACDRPIDAMHYYPHLWHLQHEAEGGRTPDGGGVRWAHSDAHMEGYSWRGYAPFAVIQPDIVLIVDVPSAAMYRVLARYVNPNEDPVQMIVDFEPEGPVTDGTIQILTFTLPPTAANVAGVRNLPEVRALGRPHAFVLTRGRWRIKLHSKNDWLLDYIVLLPADYYEATVLKGGASNRCTSDSNGTDACTLSAQPPWPKPVRPVEGAELVAIADPDDGSETKLPAAYIDGYSGAAKVDLPDGQKGTYKILVPLAELGKEHAIVMEYYNDAPDSESTATIVATVDEQLDKPGRVTIRHCPYSTLCREAFISASGEPQFYSPASADQTEYTVLLKVPGLTADFAIGKLVAVPRSTMEMGGADLMRPAPACVSSADGCAPLSYMVPPNAIVVSAADHANQTVPYEELPYGEAAGIWPTDRVKPSHLVVQLHSESGEPEKYFNFTADLTGSGGYYILLPHYHNPSNGIGATLPVTITSEDGRITMAHGKMAHCASASGCRMVLYRDEDGRKEIHLDGKVQFSVKVPVTEEPIYLDSINLVPYASYSDDLLRPLPTDLADEFLAQCAAENFGMKPEKLSEYCKKRIFSLTVAFNRGALPCGCDSSGSTSFECASFGGQCQCKPRIIGRKCDQCAPGHYNFPQCSPCNCQGPYEQCDESTGQCRCPQYTTNGPQCDQCAPNAYGHDKLIGCRPCDCDRRGSNLDLCDPVLGQCECKEHITGRQCSQCVDGHHGFPYCYECTCNLAGATPAVCNKTDASCKCKENVQGNTCEQCKPGTYDLVASNPRGCSDCFCFGVTDKCSSAEMYHMNITSTTGWSSSNDQAPVSIVEDNIEINLETPVDSINDANAIYFLAPEAYLGKALQSYGSFINYTIESKPDPSVDESVSVRSADIVLEGVNITLYYFGAKQVFAEDGLVVSAQLHPDFWRVTSSEASGSRRRRRTTEELVPASREHLMRALRLVRALKIKASYYDTLKNARLLGGVVLGTAEQMSAEGSGKVSSVEECQCPAPYSGTSCEECADGYYRVPGENNGELGACVPCKCHRHSGMCDKATGVCESCMHDTTGEHCELCDTGFYGNATSGTPYDCQLCPCPIPTAENSFADSCEVTPSGTLVGCSCLEGYIGQNCDTCDLGYWGSPYVAGSECIPCNCSGNNDLTMREACDINTGLCNKCQDHTSGDSCQQCEPWFYGDAVDVKNCTECTCSQCGSSQCDHISGVCQCKPLVEGANCDRCAADAWGLDFCTGCKEVWDCPQCNVTSGQCACQPGAGGTQCEKCESGYWNYTENGCTKCDCEADLSLGTVCDVLTGECVCAPGATGARCDQCLPYHIRIPTLGCRYCDACVHVLADEMTGLLDSVDAADAHVRNTSRATLTAVRLRKLNDTVYEYKDSAREIEETGSDNIPKLLEEALATSDQLQQTEFNAESRLKSASGALQRMENFENNTIPQLTDQRDEAVERAEFAVNEIKNLAASLGSGQMEDRQKLLEEASGWVEEMQADEPETEHAQDLVEQAVQLLENVTSLMVNRSEEQTAVAADSNEKFNDAESDVDAFKARLVENEQALVDVNETLANANVENFDEIVQQIKKDSENAQRSLDWAKSRLDGGKERGAELSASSEALVSLKTKLTDVHAELDKWTNDTQEEMGDDVADLPRQCQDKADDLSATASHMSAQFTTAKASATDALRAADVFTNMGDEIDRAEKAASEAVLAADGAKQSSEGLAVQAQDAREASMDMMRTTTEHMQALKNNLTTSLQNAEDQLNQVKNTTKMAEKKLDAEHKVLTQMVTANHESALSLLTQRANELKESATDTGANAQKIADEVQAVQTRGSQVVGSSERTESDLKSARSSLELVEQLLANVTESLAEAESAQDAAQGALDIADDKLTGLRRKIALARDTANRIPIGAEFNETSWLKLKNPTDIVDAGAHTTMSLYFKTGTNDGLLFFLGNMAGESRSSLSRSVPTDDYLALTLSGGKLEAFLWTGHGAGDEQEMIKGTARLASDVYVSDGHWHRAVIKRTGKALSLSVTSPGDEGSPVTVTSNMIAPGSTQVLHLDEKISSLYIGGVPDSASMPVLLRTRRHFVGLIEDVRMQGNPLGLWHFAHNGMHHVTGVEGRAELRQPNAGTATLNHFAGVSLNGNGYVALQRTAWNPRKDMQLTFTFRTHSPHAMLFYIGKQPDYQTIELIDGKVITRWNLGSGDGWAQSKNAYNNGKWHMVRVTRLNRTVSLTVDDEQVIEADSPGAMFELGVDDLYYVGGLPPNVPVVRADLSSGLRGCVDQLKLQDAIAVNLNDELDVVQAKGVEAGCPDMPVTGVAADGELPMLTYYNMSAAENGDSLEISLRFKTTENRGTLLRLAAKQDTPIIATLHLDGGHIVFEINNGTESAESSIHLESTDAADTKWHFITASVKKTDGGKFDVALHVDDSTHMSALIDPPPGWAALPRTWDVLSLLSGDDADSSWCQSQTL